MPDIGLILLAAGEASRMGTAKQLLDFGGQPLLRHAAETALASVCRPVIVVLGARAGEIRAALRDLPVEIVENITWEAGMGTSIQAGLEAMAKAGVEGVILALADQPLITPEILNRLVEIHAASGQPIVAARYAGTVGVPVLFSREFFPRLQALAPQQGCKGIITAHPTRAAVLDCPEAEVDIDTPSDYDRLWGRSQR